MKEREKVRILIKSIEKKDLVIENFKHRTVQNFLGLDEIREKELFNILEIDNNIYLFNKNKKMKVLREELELIEYKEIGDNLVVKNCVILDNYLINKKTLNYLYLLKISNFLEKEVSIKRIDIEAEERYLKRLSIKALSPYHFFKEAIIYLLLKKVI